MATRFKHNRNKRTSILTAVWSAIIVGIVAGILIFVDGGYLHAWLLSILVGILALYILWIPRYTTIDENNLEIQCVVELTRIDIRDIRSIRKVQTQEYKYLFPVIGSYGFFGYYGYFLNLKGWDMVKVYAGEWDNLLEIVDIYEQTYLISSRQADALIESVMQVKLMHAGRKTAKNASL